ncbi:MAG: PPA1309 family protein [Propionibacteriaceae bacterium]|nr:PPA1309 family protein [Propionibacteriaceae bacterium]
MTDNDPGRLIACLADIERHVSDGGWDQPARLFALVATKALLEVEPQLKGRVPETMEDALTAVEQDDFAAGVDVLERLEQIFFPESVDGVAIAMERAFLPPKFESEIPTHPEDAAEFVMHHPEKEDVRVVVGVLRDGSRHGLARLVSNPDDLLGAADLVPGLTEALNRTLEGATHE